MGSTTYDWSPLFSALQSTIGQLAQKKQYGDLLNTLGGGTPQPGLLSQLFNPTPVQQPSGPMAPAQMQDMQIPGGSPAAMTGTPGIAPIPQGMSVPTGTPMPGGINVDFLRKLQPQIGMPLLLQTLTSQMGPHKTESVAPGASLVDTVTGKPLYTAPQQAEYGEKSFGINPQSGKQDTFVIDKKSGQAKWLGIAPPPSIEFVNGQAVDKTTGTALPTPPIPRQAEPYRPLSQQELSDKTTLAGAEAGARAAATNVPFDPQTIDFMAEQALAGDKSVYSQLGYGGAGQQNRAALRNSIAQKASARGISGAGLAALNAEFGGLQAGERTLGNRTANVEMAVSEAQQMIPLALDASSKVDRTQFPTLNGLLQAAEKGTGGENVVRLGIATNSLINVYARAISPNGVPTVSDKDHARELLAAAWSKGQYSAGVDQLNKEMQAARRSPGAVRGEFRAAISGGEPGAAQVPDAPTTSAPASSGLPNGWSVRIKP